MPPCRAPRILIRRPRIVPGWWIVWLACVAAGPALGFAAEQVAKKSFDIPAGDAVGALKRFSLQSGVQVIFPEDLITGARTKPLKGAFTPLEAIARLLEGTDLKAAHDRQSGSFAVSRVPVPPEESSRPNG